MSTNGNNGNLQLPVTKSTNDTFTYGDQTWVWDGLAWRSVSKRRLVADPEVMTSNNTHFPQTDDQIDLGNALNRWKEIHASQGVRVNGNQVLGSQQSHITDSVGGDEIAKINEIIAALKAHGLIASS